MKKILFIESRTGGDFTMDAIWAGLVEKFGPENVIDWPPKEKHREGIPQITGDIEKDYGAERRSLCYRADSARLHALTLQEVNSLLKSGGISRIFVDEREETFKIFAQTVAPFVDVPVVMIAGHDKFWNPLGPHCGPMMYRKFEALFADNWIPEYSQSRNIFPMSYSTNFDHLWEHSRREEFLKNKLYDVCFMGYNSHGDRARFVDHLSKRYGGDHNFLFVERRPNTMDAFIRKNEYFKRMAQSRICINLRGGAKCGKALRFYEIPYVGSCMLSQVDEAKQVSPFVDQQHCVYFKNESELDNWVEILLGSDTLREKIARAGHEHAMKFHTSGARVDYIYDCLEQLSRANKELQHGQS